MKIGEILVAADVGIAMGTGTDVAMDTSVRGDLTGLMRARRPSQGEKPA